MLFQTSHVNRFADIDQIKVSVVTKSDHFVTDEPLPPTAIKMRMPAEAFLLCLLFLSSTHNGRHRAVRLTTTQARPCTNDLSLPALALTLLAPS